MRRAKEQLREDVAQQRREWLEYIPYLDANKLRFLDESSVNLAMTRLYGRAPSSERVTEYLPDVRFNRISVIAVVGLDHDDFLPFVFKGTLNGNLFRQYIFECVVPTIQEGEILFMDNLSAHKVDGISEAVETRGANVVFLPPYSPDFSPIEYIWSPVKADMRKRKARSSESICDALTYSFAQVSEQDLLNTFNHCGLGL